MITLYAQSWWQLIKFDILLLTRSFGALYHQVKAHPLRRLSYHCVDAERIIAAFELASIWYPKHVRCLQRSAALTCLLRNYGITAHMVIGTQRLPFRAHAWIEVEGNVVNDKEYTPQMYAVLDRC